MDNTRIDYIRLRMIQLVKELEIELVKQEYPFVPIKHPIVTGEEDDN